MTRILTILAALVAAATLALSAAPRAHATTIKHVVLVMEENHGIGAITPSSMPYLTSLGDKYAKATHEQAITHPSLPNYMALTAGNDIFNGSDCSPTGGCSTGADNIFHQASSWKVWAESMPKPCDHSNADPYAPRHTAAPYFTDIASECPANDIPLHPSKVPGMVTGQFILITPNLNHDAHDGSLGAADSWLKQVLGTLLKRRAFTNGSTLIEVTFDEGNGNNTVYTAYLHPSLRHVVVTKAATHYSLLRLNEELLGFPLLAHAQSAPDIRSALGL